MAFIDLTRPDDSPVVVNTEEIMMLTPVPPAGATSGPLTEGTRIEFRNKMHQDVKELIEAVRQKLNLVG